MADINQNQNSGTTGDAPKKKFDSPWNEELPPEEPKKAKIVGSLDAKPSDLSASRGDKKPVPFNIPTDVADEKVGKKIPAEVVIAKNSTLINQKPTLLQNQSMPKPADQSSMSNPMSKATPALAPIQKETHKPVGQTAGTDGPIQPEAVPVTTLPVVENEMIPKLAQSPKPAPVILPPKPENKTEPVKVALSLAPPEKIPIYPTPVAKLEPESAAMADIKPVVKAEKESAPPILPSMPKPPLETASRIEPLEKKRGEKKHIPAEIRKPVQNNQPPFYKKAKFLIPIVMVFLFALGVYLTEAGIIGIGLEKIYGLTGVESLWSGLPRNPERALGISAQSMQNQLNFKIKGTVSMTVNKTIKSPVTSPLVSVMNLPFTFRDTNVIAGIKAIATQYDYYGSDDSSGSTAADTSTFDSTTDSSAETDSNAASTTDTTTSILGDQNSDAAYMPEESTIKQIDADIEGQSSDQAITGDLVIKKLIGSSSSVSLLGTKSQLFVKSSQDIKFADNAESSKWLEFNISAVQNENPFKDLTGIKLDRGFSIIGRRSGNEKIGSIRCFKYSIDNLELGDSLDFLGIKKDSAQKIEGNIWIGVADHYLHKIDLKIIPSISSPISQMSITLEMYDYGIENSIQIPALTDKITANIAVNPNVSAVATAATTTTPNIASAATMEGRDQTRKQDLQNIKAALEKYKTANGKFPIAHSMIHLDAKDNVIQKALAAEYIANIPIDPKASDGWFYGYKSEGNTFTLSARLENSADSQITPVGDIYLHWVYNN